LKGKKIWQSYRNTGWRGREDWRKKSEKEIAREMKKGKNKLRREKLSVT